MFLALYFLFWDYFGAQIIIFQILSRSALRAMTYPEGESAEILFVIAPLITSEYANDFLDVFKTLTLILN